ncbi:MAG: enoyl-CoA hydratase/isomerase family protein [Deltaproteobacteria bacterium]|nr:enoyl-CoA hydratase/isomerase family protein [Deltaproteobacteria bacterium]
MTSTVLYEVQDRIATLTLNRPDKRNALSGELVAALADALARADHDPAVVAVILTGAGEKAFCAGGDLSPPAGDGFLALHAERRRFAELLALFPRLGKPVVAAANGHALAGGFGLLLACDFVIARRDARYGTPEIKRGLFPMMILAVLLRVLGRRRTLDLALTGREIDGDTLVAYGAANAAVDATEVMPRARAVAQELAALSPAILALGRRALYVAEDMSFAQQLDYLHSQLSINTLAEDTVEGVTAFFEKRPPVWKGR